MVIGFTTIPDSYFFTRRTSAAWATGSMFLWITPMPPASAMAMASALSVTVSMAAEMIGMRSSTARVRRVEVSASAGTMLERAGTSNTSSNASASWICMPPRDRR